MLKLCDDIETMSMVLLDGELADQELRDMELHLLACPSCKGHVERERAAHALRRQRLAAPRAPDLLRARVLRGLDEVDRQRRPRARTFLLPGAAALVAVAALAVFVTTAIGPDGAPRRDQATVASFRPRLGLEQVGTGGPLQGRMWEPRELRFQRSGTQFLDKGRKVAELTYAVLTPDGDQLSLRALIVDAEALGLDPAAAREVGGYAVWLDSDGRVAVRDGARAVILSSPSIAQRDLEALVEQSLVILRVGSDDPRR